MLFHSRSAHLQTAQEASTLAVCLQGVCVHLCFESAGRIWDMFQTRHNYILNKVLYCSMTNSTIWVEWGYLKMDCEVTKFTKWNCRNYICFRKGFSNTSVTSNVQIKEAYYTWRKLSISIPIYLNGELFGWRRNILFEICNLCSWVFSSAAMLFFYPPEPAIKTVWFKHCGLRFQSISAILRSRFLPPPIKNNKPTHSNL